MKKIACLLFVLLSLRSFSQTETKTETQTETDSVATIIFYRNAVHSGSALSVKLKDNQGKVIRLYNHSYYVYQCKPGSYRFYINNQKGNYVDVHAKAGKTRYYRASVYSGFWSMEYEVLETDSAKAVQSLSKSTYLDMGKPLVRPRNRVGVTVAGGFGFSQKTVLSTTEGDDINMSFGGGGGFGGFVGRELTKHLDLEIAYRHFSSSLSPNIENGSMKFKRDIISITPAYIIPIDGGYTRRLKLGLGADIYLANTLEIDIAQIPKGFKDTWKYSDAFGYHISLMYEINPGPHWSLLYGVRYYAVNHSFSSGGSYFPTDDFFIKPNGSGLDFVFGAGFHF